MKYRFLFTVWLVSTVAWSETNSDWQVIPLIEGHKFIYRDSIADSVITSNDDDFFPIQHLSRPFKKDFTGEVETIVEPILKNLKVDRHTVSTSRGQFGKFDKGEGYFVEYRSVDEYGNDLKTCLAFKKRNGRIHAYYLQAASISLPACSDKLIKVARMSLYK